jgi:L-amino acid N-acyltransferase YncA
MKSSVKVRESSIADCPTVAQLHKNYIRGGFLSSLGTSMLELIYEAITSSLHSVCLVSEDNGKIIGYISATVNVADFYKDFLRRNTFKAGWILLPRMFNWKTAKGILETLFYPQRKAAALPDAELLSIVVEKDYRERGVSGELFEALTEELRKRKVHEFKVVVGANLVSACKFYERMKGVLKAEIEVHKNEKSLVYVWKL